MSAKNELILIVSEALKRLSNIINPLRLFADNVFMHGGQIEGRGEGHFLKILQVVPSYLPTTRYGSSIRSVDGLARASGAWARQSKYSRPMSIGPTARDGLVA
jgi:hypothetical protein